jgi:predicted esterase
VADVEELTDALRLPAGEPAGALVLFHGRGTSEQDVAPLIDVLDPRVVPGLTGWLDDRF